MKIIRFSAALLLMLTPIALIAGCGGGGGGGGGGGNPTATPVPTTGPTSTIGARVLVVQLRDSARQPVDGIVTLSTTVVVNGIVTVVTTMPLTTTGGEATFNRNVAAGATTVSAEVDGVVTVGTVNVATSGSTIYSLTITPSVTPVPSATLPPPPSLRVKS